jgi:FBP C-terminal treble-clef zinc-finger
MITPTKDNFEQFLIQQSIKQHKNPAKRLEWNSELELLPKDIELFALFNRGKTAGVLFFLNDSHVRSTSFEVSKKASNKDGASKPAVCDICQTQRGNGEVRIISFYRSDVTISRQHSTGWLCCGDLLCSAHVRNLSGASQLSRAQLRETELDHNNNPVPLSTESMKLRLTRNARKLMAILYGD